MNFFGHAAVARRTDDDPAFLLGAMAPDLLPLCGAIPGTETSPLVAAGQAHHLSVDARFHAAPAFTTLTAWAAGALRQRGVARGAARGAAHVGVELFLDGELGRDAGASDAFTRALADADTTRVPFAWHDDPSRVRWERLIGLLRDGAVPTAYRDPDFVADRLIGALSRRPRLALGERDAATLRAFLPLLAARVASDAPALVAAVL